MFRGLSQRLLLYNRIVQSALRQSIDAVDDAIAADRHEHDTLFFARLEPHGGPGRDLQPKPVRLLAIEPQRTIGLKEMTMGANLDGAISCVRDGEFDRLATIERYNIAFA